MTSPLRVRYQTIELNDVDVHVRTLRDTQQFRDDDRISEELGISSATWPLFGVVWGSSRVLARLMLTYEVAGKRILEVGCGIGLASLILNHREADITATDYHPEVEGFLEHNVGLNGGSVIPFVRTGWADAITDLGVFDLIIGADLLYERDHAALLSGFIDQHAEPVCDVIIIDPDRGHRVRFSKEMATRGYAHSRYGSENEEDLGKGGRAQVLQYSRR